MARGSPTITMPFTIVRDQQEKAPYQFMGLKADSKHKYKPLIVPVKVVDLPTADYSIEGLETIICVERKSKDDLFGTLRDEEHRERFRREHERMTSFAYAAVVIESTWPEILQGSADCDLHPMSVWRTAQKWQHRYGVPWLAIGPRAMAEEFTFQTLRFFHEEFCNADPS